MSNNHDETYWDLWKEVTLAYEFNQLDEYMAYAVWFFFFFSVTLKGVLIQVYPLEIHYLTKNANEKHILKTK